MKKLLTLIFLLSLISFACYPQVSKKLIESSKEKIGYDIPPSYETRQGGDNIGNATVINALPYSDNGTTSLYNDDYNGNCAPNGNSRDVVYSYSPSANENVTISLCGSSYNTTLYVFENSVGNIIACNDDYTGCGQNSQLDYIPFIAGNTYYIIIDGYRNNNNGNYIINVTSDPPPYEIRVIEDMDGLLTVQMKASSGNVPLIGTVISDIGFALRWPTYLGNYVTDVALVCTDYNIIPFDDVDSYYTAGGWNFRSYTQASNYIVTSGWTVDTWETIAKFRTVEIDGWTSTGWSFEIAPDGWLNITWGADPIWEQDFSPYIPNINGSVSGYDFPRYYSMIWVGGNSNGTYNQYSWNNPSNWETICGLPEPYAPDTYANCIIPSGATYYPRYSQQTDSHLNHSYCYDLFIEAGGEVNFTGDPSSGSYTQLFITNDLTIEDGATPGKLDLVNDARVEVANETNINGSNSARVGMWSGLYCFGDLYVQRTNGLTIEKTGWVQAVDVSTYVGAPTAIVIKEGDGDFTFTTGGGPGNFYQRGPISYVNSGSISVGTFIKNDAENFPGSFYIHMVGPTVDDPAYTGPGTGVPLGNFDLLELNTFAYLFDEPSGQWQNIYPIPYPIQTATGLILSDVSDEDNTYVMEGEILSGNVNKSVSYGGSNLELISNPYPTAIDWNSFRFNNSSMLGTTFRIWNPNVGNYGAYAAGGGTWGTNGVLFAIQSGQGFFVTTRGNGTITFSDDDKYFSRYPLLKSNDDFKLIQLLAEGNTYKDELIIKFTEEATTEFDEDFDAEKWDSYYADATEIYSLSSDNKKLTINTLPPVRNEVMSIPVHFKCGADSAYRLTFKNLSSLVADGIEIWLEDKTINTNWLHIGIQDSIYTFIGSPEDNIDRFIIHFLGPTGMNYEINGEDDFLKIYAANSNLYIFNDSGELIKEVVVYNMMGSEILRTGNIRQSLYQLQINAITGYYIVKVLTDKNVYSEKVFLMK